MRAFLEKDIAAVPSSPDQTYNAQLTAGGLLLPESRKVAKMLLAGVDEEKWFEAIHEDNLLQKRSSASTKRQTRLIRNRLAFLSPDLLKLVAEGTRDEATQALLVAAIRHSRLLRDFMGTVLKEAYRTFRDKLEKKDWGGFIAACAEKDPTVASWSQTTKRKLGAVVFNILAEAGYVDGTRSLRLKVPAVLPGVRHHLEEARGKTALTCMDITK